MSENNGTNAQPDTAHQHGDDCGCGHDHSHGNGAITEATEATTFDATQRYAMCAGVYVHLFHQLADVLKARNALPEDERGPVQQHLPMFKSLMQLETAAEDAMKAVFTEHPHGRALQTYVVSGRSLFGRIARLGEAGENATSAQHRPATKAAFDQFRAAEMAYAELGYRTVTIDEWAQSVPMKETLHCNTHGLLLVPRAEGEKKSLASAQLLHDNPALRIAAPGQNMKKQLRNAIREQRRGGPQRIFKV